MDRKRKMNRREFLRVAGLAAASITTLTALEGCASPVAPTPAPKVTPTVAPKAAPTLAPTATPIPAFDPDAVLAKAIKTGMLRALEPNPKKGGRLRWPGYFAARGFDPYINLTRDVSSKTHNNLVRWNPMDGFRTTVPELAVSWERSDDGKQYTFKLRPNVKWHDGTDFTADDVVATYMRVVEPPEGVVIYPGPYLPFLAGVEKIDRLTVRFELSEPRFYFIELMGWSQVPVLQKKALEENDMDLTEVYSPGTGPFVFKDYKVGEVWLFARNPNYWNPDLPYLDEVELIHMVDWTARGTAVMTGQAEYAQLVDYGVWKEAKEKFSDVIGVSKHEGEHACVHFRINCEREPLNDPKVRRAIFLGVNRHNLLKAYAESEPIPLASARWVSQSFPAAMPAEEIAKIPGYKEDNTEEVAQAKQLLAEAGYPDGFGPIEIVSGSKPAHSDILAPAMQAELQKIGISSTIRVVEVAARLDDLRGGNFDMIIDVGFYTPINEFVIAWEANFTSGSRSNYSRYSNPEFDALVKELLLTDDEAKRKELYRKGMDMLDQNPPIYPLGFTEHCAMWRHEVKGHFEEKRLFTVYGPPDTFWLED